ncbi:MAG: NAD(P)-dependent oxidoreductase [Solirubrobacteraceae bacterium]
MRVLLTGASGFIGGYALEALVGQGHEVCAVSRSPGPAREGVAWYECDLLSPDAAERLVEEAQASHLLHLAWYVQPGSFWNAAENEQWVDASLRLLRAFGEGGGRRAVMAGTCAEYAWGGEEPLRERDSPDGPATALEPVTLYGACKHATHIAAAAVARQLGVSFAWGRIFFLYGPGEDSARLVCQVARSLLAGEQVPTTDGEQRRDFMHVRDVASAFVELLSGDLSGPVNIASGQAAPIREIVTLIAEQAGGLERVRFGALERRAGEPERIVADVERLRGAVGFTLTIGLREGLAETVARLREEG